MKVRRTLFALCAATVLSFGSFHSDASIVPVNPMPDMSITLDDQFGVGGRDGDTTYFIDPSSYYMNTYGNTTHAGSSFYIADPSMSTPGVKTTAVQATVNYLYFNNNTDMRLLVKSVVTKDGQDIMESMLAKDGGFLYALFWNIADHKGMRYHISPKAAR